MSAEVLDSNEESVEYVELLNVPVYEDNQEISLNDENDRIVSLASDDTEEVVTVNEDDVGQIEYVEAEEIQLDETSTGLQPLDGHTIFIHEGKQYIIPNELNQDGQTIILGDGDDTEYVIQADIANEIFNEASVANCVETCYEHANAEENVQHLQRNEQDDNTCYIIYGENGETIRNVDNEEDTSTLSKQYAILKDGKLHIQANGIENESNEIQEKLQVLEASLNYTDETMTDDNEIEVKGRNMITGQTISLNGFLEKIRKKTSPGKEKHELSDSERYTPNIKKQRRHFYQARSSKQNFDSNKQDYILIPPINKKVVVGKTPDGKRIIGKILQIQKKITPETSDSQDLSETSPKIIPSIPPEIIKPPEQPKPPEEEAPENQQIEELIINNTGKILHVENRNLTEKNSKKTIKRKYMSKSTIPDENLIRTLSGLMDLESIQKNLIDKNLIIKHVTKKTFQGKAIPGKVVTYHFGYMQRTETVDCFNEPRESWLFVPSSLDEERNSCDNSIDLSQEHHDSQQLDMVVNNDCKITFSSLTEADDTDVVCTEVDAETHVKHEFEETVTVNLIVTEDEHGKKRTKVMIPQLADREYTCHICGRSFTTPGSLKRHISSHDPTSRPMQCMTCSHRFADESSLKKHMLLHAGVKKFRCEICLKNFVHQGDLNFHRKIHDPVKRYKCDVCSKQFNRYSNMMRHIDIHRVKASAYKCDLCGCQYNFISSLTRHIVNIHMGSETVTPKDNVESMETS